MKLALLIREPALLVVIIVAGAVCLQVAGWVRMKSDCVLSGQVGRTSLPPLEIRWGDERGGIRLGTMAGRLDVASLGGLPLFIENTSSSFLVMDCWLMCRFKSFDHESSSSEISYHWCAPRLLVEGLSHRKYVSSVPGEPVALPPHSISWILFDGFGDQMYWGPHVRLDPRFKSLQVSDGEVVLWSQGSKGVGAGPAIARLRLWVHVIPEGLPDTAPRLRR